jgi:uncharacterized phage protein (TIGR02220 family)
MDKIIIPLDFFKELQANHHHIRLLWIKWLSDYSDHLFKPNFVDYFISEIKDKVTNTKLDASLFNYETIRDAYNIGLIYFNNGFKIEKKRSKTIKYEDEVLNKAKEVINYLNEKALKSYKSTKSNIEPIIARFKEGYNINDFKLVIDKKVAEWQGTEFEKYIRPITLFRPNNFENYINEPDKIKNNGKQSNIKKLSNATNIAKSFFS